MLLTFPHNTLCQYISITEWSKKKKIILKNICTKTTLSISGDRYNNISTSPFQEIDTITFQLPNHISTPPQASWQIKVPHLYIVVHWGKTQQQHYKNEK